MTAYWKSVGIAGFVVALLFSLYMFKAKESSTASVEFFSKDVQQKEKPAQQQEKSVAPKRQLNM